MSQNQCFVRIDTPFLPFDTLKRTKICKFALLLRHTYTKDQLSIYTTDAKTFTGE